MPPTSKDIQVRLVVTDTGAVRVLDRTGKALGVVERGAASASRRLNEMANVRIGNLARRLVAVGAAALTLRTLTRSIRETIDAGISFQQAIANIGTLLQAQVGAITQLEDGIKSLLGTVPVSADELGVAAYQIVSAGITDVSRALVVLETSAQLGAAGLSTTVEAANILTSALNAFAKDGLSANEAANVLFKTVQLGKTTISDLAVNFGDVAPIAAVAGVSFQQLQAATAALTTTGLKTRTAQTSLRQAIVGLLRPTDDLKSIYQLLGIESGRALLAQRGLVGAFTAVKDAAQGNDAALAKALGSVEALNAVLSLTGPASDAFNASLSTIEDGIDSLTGAFDVATDTLRAQTVLLNETLSKIRIDAFDELEPILIELTKAARQFFESFGPTIVAALRSFLTQTLPDLVQGIYEFVGGLSELGIVSVEARNAWASAASSLRQFAQKAQEADAINARVAETLKGIEDQGYLTDDALEKLAGQMIEAEVAGVALSTTNLGLLQQMGLLDAQTLAATNALRLGATATDEMAVSSKALEEVLEDLNKTQEPRLAGARAVVEARQTELETARALGAADAEIQARQQALFQAQTSLAETAVAYKREQLAAAEALDAQSPVVAQLRGELEKAEAAAAGLVAAQTAGASAAKEQSDQTLRNLERIAAARAAEAAALERAGAPAESVAAATKVASEATLAAKQRAVELKQALLEAAIAAGKSPPEIAALTAELQAARAEADAVGKDLAGGVQQAAQTSVTAARDIRISLGDAFRQGMSDALEAVVAGTRDLKDVWKGVGVSILRSFSDAFTQVLIPKKAFDITLGKNAENIGTMFEGTGNRIFASFSNAFAGIGAQFNRLASGIENGVAKLGITGAAGATLGAFGALLGGAGVGALGAEFLGLDPLGGAFAGAAFVGVQQAIQAAVAAQVTAQLATVGSGGVGGLLAAGQTTGVSSTLGAGTGAAAAGAGLAAAFIGFVIGKLISNSLAPSEGDLFKKALNRSVTTAALPVVDPLDQFNKQQQKEIFQKGDPTVLDRRRAGESTSVRAQTLGLLFLGGIGDQSPIRRGPTSNQVFDFSTKSKGPFGIDFKEFNFAAGKIEGTLDRFPDSLDDLSDALAGGFTGGGFAKAINLLQVAFSGVVRGAAGKSIPTSGQTLVDRNPQLEGVAGKQPTGVEDDPNQKVGNLVFLETNKQAMQRLIEEGLIEPLDVLLKDLADFMTRDLPRSVRDGIPQIIDDMIAAAGGVRLGEGDLTVEGEQLERAIQVSLDAFAATADALVSASAVLAQTGDADEAIKVLGDSIRATVFENATTALTDAFFQTARIPNLLQPIFDTLDIGIERILSAKGPRQAQKRTDQLLADLTIDFEFLSRNIEKLQPALERFAEVQEELRLALTSFNQAAEQSADVGEAIDNARLDFLDGGEFEKLGKVALKAREQEVKKTQELSDLIGGFGGGLPARLRDLEDNELKKLPEILAENAQAIVTAANAERAVLLNRIALTEKWISLIPAAQDALATIETIGAPQQEQADRQFELQRARVQELIRQFRTGDEDERVAAAQQLAQLGPNLLSAAQAAGILPGSQEFENLRTSLVDVLTDIEDRARQAELNRDRLQQRIADLNAQTVARLDELARIENQTQRELKRRSRIAIREEEKNGGTRGDVKDTRTAVEKTFALLERGINVFGVNKTRGKRNPFGPLEVPSARQGGLYTAREGLVMLHGPELIVPLNRVSVLTDTVREALSELQNADTPLSDRNALTSALRRALAQRPEIDVARQPQGASLPAPTNPQSIRAARGNMLGNDATVNIAVDAAMTKIINGLDDGAEAFDETRRIEDMFVNALRSARVRDEIRRMLQGVV